MTWCDYQYAAADLFRQPWPPSGWSRLLLRVGGLAVGAAAIYWIKSGQARA
jgi:hypothetical protein